MTPEAYEEFTHELHSRLESDDRVIGLVAVGSMAQLDYFPDQWSDHDFFVIVKNNYQESFRTDFQWLPNNNQIVYSFRETAHGIKVLYSDGHLLEFAVFNMEEMELARVNRFRVLIDRANIEEHLQQIVDATGAMTDNVPDDTYHFGQFLTNILVGVGRYRRGEEINGRWFTTTSAVNHLIVLIKKHVPSARKQVLDNLDGMRRFELAYPEIAKELIDALQLQTPASGKALLKLAEKTLAGRLSNYPHEAVKTVMQKITSS